jgi:hypothetical protein
MRSRLVVAFKGIKFIVELVHDLILLVLDEFQLENIFKGAASMRSDITERTAGISFSVDATLNDTDAGWEAVSA